MDRAEMINSLAEAMGVKTVGKEDKEFSRKYNTSTGTIYCNRSLVKSIENEADDERMASLAVFPVKRLAM